MTIGLGILFQDKALLCIDACEYRPQEGRRFNYNAIKYFRLTGNIFYVQGGLVNASSYIMKKMRELNIDSFEKLEQALTNNVFSSSYSDFVSIHSKKYPDILTSWELNYYTVIFAGQKTNKDLFLAYMRFSLDKDSKCHYSYSFSDTQPAMYTTLNYLAEESDELWKNIQLCKNMAQLRKACIRTVELLANKSHYITPWGVFIELNTKKVKTYSFNNLKKLLCLIKGGNHER